MSDVMFLAVLAMGVVAAFALLRREVVFQYERALSYTNGRFTELLGPGAHWFVPLRTRLVKVDVRPRSLVVGGQEVLSADGLTLKLSLAATYVVADPVLAINEAQNYHEALYLALQLALRELVGATELDALLTRRGELSAQLLAQCSEPAAALGLELRAVGLKDIMLPGKLKDTFAQVVSARQQGLAALEQARGETAALRSLANAAKLLEGNPALLQLRLLQTLGGSTGNTLMLGVPPGVPPGPPPPPPPSS